MKKKNKTEIESLLKKIKEKESTFALVEYLDTIIQCDPKELDKHDIDLLKIIELVTPPCDVGDVVYKCVPKACVECGNFTYTVISLIVKSVIRNADKNGPLWIIEASSCEWTCRDTSNNFYFSQESAKEAAQGKKYNLKDCTI